MAQSATLVGTGVGDDDGTIDGDALGDADGPALGLLDGDAVGRHDGELVGDDVGFEEGFVEGDAVGASVLSQHDRNVWSRTGQHRCPSPKPRARHHSCMVQSATLVGTGVGLDVGSNDGTALGPMLGD